MSARPYAPSPRKRIKRNYAAVAGLEPVTLSAIRPLYQLSYTANHPRLCGAGVVDLSQSRRRCILCPLYLRRSQRSEGLGGRLVFRWQDSNLQSICLELLSAWFRSCSHTPYLKRFYQVAVLFYQLIKLHRNHKNRGASSPRGQRPLSLRFIRVHH